MTDKSRVSVSHISAISLLIFFMNFTNRWTVPFNLTFLIRKAKLVTLILQHKKMQLSSSIGWGQGKIQGDDADNKSDEEGEADEGGVEENQIIKGWGVIELLSRFSLFITD